MAAFTAFKRKIHLVRWSFIVKYSQFLYLIIYVIVVITCTSALITQSKYDNGRTTMKGLQFELSEESQFPKCNLGFEKNGTSITALFEDFKLPNSAECRLQLEPPEFREKMKTWLHNKADLLEQVTAQKIVRIRSKLTGEETLINSIRDKRPVPESSSMQKYLKNLIESSLKGCDFCDYKRNTAIDIFGRIETAHSYTMANAFKFDQYHSMVVFRSHDPVKWNFTQLLDAFNVVEQWFTKVKEQDSSCVYRHVYWDMFPKAGGSQIHPHIHMTANSKGFHGVAATWASAAQQYNQQNYSRNFYEDLVYLHDQLGLVTTIGKAVALAHINPRKDNELIIMGQESDTDFYRLLHAAVRVYMDDMKIYPFSMVISYPTEESRPFTPVFARVASRGDVSEHRSDVSSLELFSAANVNSDPKNIAKHLRRYVKKFTADLD